jgi:hypothetical protein
MLAAPDLGAASLAAFAAGAGLALAGIGLMLARRGGVGAGLVVLAGAAVFTLPWLAAAPPPPELPEPAEPALTAAEITVSADRRRTVALPPAPEPPPPLPGRPAARLEIEAREAEPNDTAAGANLAPLGVAIDGSLTHRDRDYFAVDVPAGTRGEIVANLVTEDAILTLTLFDDAGQALGTASTYSQLAVLTTSVARLIERPRYVVLVLAPDGALGEYQLTVAARPR